MFVLLYLSLSTKMVDDCHLLEEQAINSLLMINGLVCV